MWNDEYRRKKSESTRKYLATHEHSRKAKAVICVETGEVFRSQGAAERATGVNHGGISGVCRGLLRSAGGLHWKYWQGDIPEAE